jgi:DNA transformation protein
LPERLYDDPEELTGWARAALAAAQRAALRKRPKVRKTAKKVAKKKTASRVVPAKRSSRASRDR